MCMYTFKYTTILRAVTGISQLAGNHEETLSYTHRQEVCKGLALKMSWGQTPSKLLSDLFQIFPWAEKRASFSADRQLGADRELTYNSYKLQQ